MADFSTNVVRADDLLNLTFDFFNLHLVETAGQPPQLVRIDPGQPAFMVVRLPPQHIAESAYTADPGSGILLGEASPPVESRMASPSRLGFRVPDGMTAIPFTLAALLDWNALTPNVPDNALPDPPDLSASAPRPGPPTEQQTDLEVPYRLDLSPDASGRWSHAIDAVTHNGVTELWHTRLGVIDSDDPDGPVDESVLPALRAVYTPDLNRHDDSPQIDGALKPEFRRDIVTGSSDFSPGPPGTTYPAPPLRATHFSLSPLGASTDLQGLWLPAGDPNAPQLGIQSWRHVVAGGRDQTVRVVQLGFLYPLGNRAAHLDITERKLAKSNPQDAGHGEYLVTTTWIAVLEPDRDYDSLPADGIPNYQHMPLRQVRITTKTVVVPPGGEPAPFHVIAQDWAGHTVDFTMPLLFVPPGMTQAQMQELYGESGQLDLGGRPMALGPEGGDPAGSTTLPVDALHFSADFPGSLDPPCFPYVDQASVRVPAIAHLLGSSQRVDAVNVTLLDPEDNSGGVFAQIKGGLPLDIPTDKAGGITSPKFAIAGLSRSQGPVPKGAEDIGTAIPAEQLFHDLAGANLLGGIRLADVITPVTDLTQLPALQQASLPDSLTTKFSWAPPLTRPAPSPLTLEDSSQLVINAETTVPLSTTGQPGEPTTTITGQLTNFSLDFGGVVNLSLASLDFAAGTGKKVSVVPKGMDITFANELQFLNELADIIPSGGFAGQPELRISPQGVIAGYSLGLPSAGLAVFSLENILLSAVVSLPFDGHPASLRLAFSERGNPFLVTVAMVGGSGFFAIEVDSTKVLSIEGQIELGANLSVDLGLVTANVHVMAGFYFGIADGILTFSAYLRIGGSVELLGVAGISLEIYLALTYDPHVDPNSVGGQATVSVGVHLLMFTKHVPLTAKRRFAFPSRGSGSHHAVGGPVDPTFEDLITPADWENYCRAFV
ncbi:hypothetical protein ACFY1P_03570 [Streptomyces sp. NPDC001407]|uniref:hypothetical protein n=1 Tax=Streptomyces sp. NPDC001407 TaxID=3364573 RepID=UPI0036C51777